MFKVPHEWALLKRPILNRFKNIRKSKHVFLLCEHIFLAVEHMCIWLKLYSLWIMWSFLEILLVHFIFLQYYTSMGGWDESKEWIFVGVTGKVNIRLVIMAQQEQCFFLAEHSFCPCWYETYFTVDNDTCSPASVSILTTSVSCSGVRYSHFIQKHINLWEKESKIYTQGWNRLVEVRNSF